MAAEHPIEGILTAMITPFTEDGAIDESAARRVARYLIENGSHGVVVAGTTGEGATMTDDEQISLLRAVIEEIGDEALVVCGTGTNDTRHSRELSKAAEDAGAHSVLVVTPYYNKPNPAGISAHFESVAGAVGCDVILYNIPSRCVINIEPDQLAELAQIDNVVAVKQANDDQLAPVEGLAILAGNDNTFFRTLEMGEAGGITVASHLVGPQMRELYDAAKSGDMDTAREIDAKLQPFFEALAVTANPIPVKAGAEMLGIASARARLPIVEADEQQKAVIREALEAQGLSTSASGVAAG
jgi:4-hydroxy-tetrahydrodipicolinate synthase